LAAPHHGSVIRPDRLLLATDGSEDAMLAARVAIDLSLRTGARLGSVSTNVLRAARCPVLIYSRAAGESMGRASQDDAVPRSRQATPSKLHRKGS
jgi:hypothetical protein